jgi:hypothetical protein
VKRLQEALRGPRLPLAVGLVLALVGLLAWRPSPVGIWHDDGVYALLGRALAHGGGLHYVGVPGAPPAVKFPPLYPALLSGIWLVTDDVDVFNRVAVGLNLLFLVVAGGAFALYLRDRLKLSSPLAFVGAVFGWAFLELWWTAFVPLSEPLFLMLLVFLLARVARAEGEEAAPASHGGAGELMALAATGLLLVYARTAGVAVVGGAVVGLVWRRRWRSAGALAAGVGVGLLPWVIWTARAAARVPAPMRDILGGYSGWLRGQIAADPLAFLAGLPSAFLLLAQGFARGLVPGVGGWAFTVLGTAVVLVALLGLTRLWRRSPAAAGALVLYLGMIAIWPFRDPRLIAPVFPLVVACTLLGGRVLWHLEAPPARAVTRGIAVLWLLGFAVGAGMRLFDEGATRPQAIRSRQLAGTITAVEEMTPPDAVVGAPELWAAIPLYTGRQGVPSAPFRPGATDGPVWGRPVDQYRIWESAGLQYVVTEAGGKVHGAALDRIQERCPGALRVAASWEGQSLVEVKWDDACRARLMRDDDGSR